MRIPKQVLIGGRNIKIKSANIEHLGDADYEKGVIRIKKGMTKEAREAVFFHEAFHMMNTTVGHKVLDSLAEQTYQMLRANNLLK